MTATSTTRSPYNAKLARLGSACRAAAAILDLYTWEGVDGDLHFSTEPVLSQLSNPEFFDQEVKQIWSGLRSALVVAGVIDGETTARLMGTGQAVFLRVQTRQDATGAVWVTRAVFEVLMGVNSYGYADGAALDSFYTFEKKAFVRVLRHVVPLVARADYLAGDMGAVELEQVIGSLAPNAVPVTVDGWAVVGDLADNPEPDFYGFDSPRLIVYPTSAEGVPGPRGEPGEKGTQGLNGQQGEPGPMGPAGPVGPVGPTGPQGEPGTGGGGGPVEDQLVFGDAWPTVASVWAVVAPFTAEINGNALGNFWMPVRGSAADGTEAQARAWFAGQAPSGGFDGLLPVDVAGPVEVRLLHVPSMQFVQGWSPGAGLYDVGGSAGAHVVTQVGDVWQVIGGEVGGYNVPATAAMVQCVLGKPVGAYVWVTVVHGDTQTRVVEVEAVSVALGSFGGGGGA